MDANDLDWWSRYLRAYKTYFLFEDFKAEKLFGEFKILTKIIFAFKTDLFSGSNPYIRELKIFKNLSKKYLKI